MLTHGTLDAPEFQRQTRDFAAALRAAGKPVELIVGKGYNHFEMGETLGNPYGLMGRAVLDMMRLRARRCTSPARAVTIICLSELPPMELPSSRAAAGSPDPAAPRLADLGPPVPPLLVAAIK